MNIYLGENIKRLRRKKNITQETLAEFLGVTFQSVSRWERGEGYPDITLLIPLARFFGVTVDSLLNTDKTEREGKIRELISLYDNCGINDIPILYEEFKAAARKFPDEYRILVRYMELIQETRIFGNSSAIIKSGEYKKLSAEICRLYDIIQKHCTDDSIRIKAKRIMISHLLWKYDCLPDENGSYHKDNTCLIQAKEIAVTLAEAKDSKEIILTGIHEDSSEYFENSKKALEELLFLLQELSFGYFFHRSAEERIKVFNSYQTLTDSLYQNDDYGKNTFMRLYNYGHLGHLYHQAGDDKKALENLRLAAECALKLDENKDAAEKLKRYNNYGNAYREKSASEFMKAVMTEHYPLSDNFRQSPEFKEIISLLK